MRTAPTCPASTSPSVDFPEPETPQQIAAHPLAAMWDNGGDPVAMLAQQMAVRRIGLRNFGERSIPPGAPLSTLGAVLMPLYFHHR